MDEQVLELMRDQFERLHQELGALNTTLKDHTDMDRQYWQKIDQQEAQISLIKWVGSGLSVSGLLGWLFSHFGKH